MLYLFCLLDVNDLEDVSTFRFFSALVQSQRNNFLILQGTVQAEVVQGMTLTKDSLTNPGG